MELSAAVRSHEVLAHPVAVAWDVALRGEDQNAVAVVQGPFVRELHTWRADDMHTSYARVEGIGAAALDQYATPAVRKRRRTTALMGDRLPRPTLVIDEAGMGGPAVDEMKKRGYTVVGFIGAAAPTAPAFGTAVRYLNRRAEAYWLFRLALERGEVALPRSETLAEEALATEWQINAQDKIQIIAKDEVRRALGRSPDLLDAVVMGLWYTLSQAQRGRWGHGTFTL